MANVMEAQRMNAQTRFTDGTRFLTFQQFKVLFPAFVLGGTVPAGWTQYKTAQQPNDYRYNYVEAAPVNGVQQWSPVAASEAQIEARIKMISGILESTVQAFMDQKAQSVGYDNINSAISYATEPSVAKFQNEGIAFRAWRSQCWEAAYTLQAQFQPGQVAPTAAQIIAALPALTLPAA